MLLAWGARGGIRNTRGHEAKELATNQDIIHLLEEQEKGLAINPLLLHWCSNCKKFFEKDKFDLQWIFEKHDSTSKDKLDGKCLGCRTILDAHEEDLKKKMTEHNYESLKLKIEFVQDMGLEVAAKLLQESEEVLEKFRTQDKMRAFLGTLKRVDNYKTILRSVGIIDEMVNDA